jgi:hypothetical protein
MGTVTTWKAADCLCPIMRGPSVSSPGSSPGGFHVTGILFPNQPSLQQSLFPARSQAKKRSGTAL